LRAPVVPILSASPPKNELLIWGDMPMASITEVASKFFEACETGQGWDGCRMYCAPGATFRAQAEPLAEIKTLQAYAEWMKGLLTILPVGSYELKSFATDEKRKNVCAYAVFSGTHRGQGGPVPPTGKGTKSDYVYVMEFEGDKIRHMTKIWHAGWAMKELGWM
jgi:predicted ester cyclase